MIQAFFPDLVKRQQPEFVSEHGYEGGKNTVCAGWDYAISKSFVDEMSDTLTCELPSVEDSPQEYKYIRITFYSDIGESYWEYKWTKE